MAIDTGFAKLDLRAVSLQMKPALFMNIRRSILLLALLLGAPTATDLSACSVPVFRYALEHWTPDRYEGLVFHRGELTEIQQALVKQLNGEPGNAARANLRVRTVDLDELEAAEWNAVWASLGAESLPWMLVRPDQRTGINWLRTSQPLTPSNVSSLLDSPARKEIAKRIAGGDSTVWLLLESGDEEADRAAAEQLETRLKYLGSVLTLPELSAVDIANGLVSVGAEGLKLKFSSLRVSRKDAAESSFVQMLLGVEDDLHEINEPMVFPIFGQGRALYALVGAGINNEMIDTAAMFLTGSCSCEVKEQNPGVDLLLAADWVGMVERQASGVAATAAETEAIAERVAAEAPEVVTFSASTPAVPAASAPSPKSGVGFGLPIFLLLGVIGWAVLRGR